MTPLNVQQLALRPHGVAGEPISFRVGDGQIAALFGRPGSGIRAILRALAGLEPVRGGEIRLGEQPVQGQPPNRRRIALVQRDSALFPGTVQDNVAFGLKRGGWPKSDRGRRVAEVLELVGMTGAERDRTDILTEGERARVILARAIAPKPAALLVESPTWFVPEVDRIGFRGRLREVFQSLDIPVVISTHDVGDAVGIADQLLVVHDGAVRQAGSVSRVLAGPSSIEVAELVGYVTLIRGQVDDGWILEPGAGAIPIPQGFPLQGTARALGHPAVMLGVPDGSGLGCGVAGVLERVRAIGPTHLLDLRVGERTIEVRWEWDQSPPEADSVIAIAVTPGTLRFFNEPNVRRPAATDDEDDAQTQASGRARGAVVSADEDAPPDREEADRSQASMPPGDTAAPVDVEPEDFAPVDSTPTVEDAREMRPARSTVSEFTPSQGLMAEPAPPREDPEPERYEPYEPWQPSADAPETFTPDGAPAPAPAPPRAPVDPSRSAPRTAQEAEDDDSVEAMAPWLQVSRPRDEPPTSPTDPHRGMPLD